MWQEDTAKKKKKDSVLSNKRNEKTRDFRCAVLSHSAVSNSLRSHGPVACQAPLFMGFPRQECWRGLPFLTPGDLSNAGIEPMSPILQMDS